MVRLLFTILCFSILFPLNVNQELAGRVASNLFIERANEFDFQVESINLISEDSYDLFYVFNLAPRGFILVSADDRVLPILGYSFDNNFSYSDQMPTNTKYLLDLLIGWRFKLTI